MFSIDLRVLSSKGFIPNIGFRNSVSQFSFVTEVSVSDVLSQPILGPLDFRLVGGGFDLCQPLAELGVLPLVVFTVIPVDVLGVADLFFLIYKVVSHVCLKFLDFRLAHWVNFHSSEVIKEYLVFTVQSIILK